MSKNRIISRESAILENEKEQFGGCLARERHFRKSERDQFGIRPRSQEHFEGED